MTAREFIELVIKRLSSGGNRAAGGDGIISPAAILGAGKNDYTAREYPSEFVPDTEHYYDVVYAPPGQHNARGAGNPNVELGGTMQTIEEHNEALGKYVRPGMTPKQLRVALQLGKEEEKKNPHFWAESKTRPVARFSVGSSAVEGIRITPDGHVEVKWRGKPSKTNPTGWYTFGAFDNPHEASKAAVELMKRPSIGQAVMPEKIVQKMKSPAPGTGSWNSRYYNGAYAV